MGFASGGSERHCVLAGLRSPGGVVTGKLENALVFADMSAIAQGTNVTTKPAKMR